MDDRIDLRVQTDRVTLDAIRMAGRQYFSDEALTRMEMAQYADHLMGETMLELSLLVYGQQLEPDTQVLEFEQQACAPAQEKFVVFVPESRVDYLLMALPRWLQWRRPRTKALLATTVPRSVPVMVKVKRKVTIERRLHYPDMTMALPPDRMGEPIYVERLRHEPFAPR